MLLSGQMLPLNFAVLLYRAAVYFRFRRGLIAILPSGLGFFRLLAAAISRKFGSIYPRAVLRAVSLAPFWPCPQAQLDCAMSAPLCFVWVIFIRRFV